MRDILLALRDLLIPPNAPPPHASARYHALLAAARRAGFPALYAAHPAAVRNSVALLLGLLLLVMVLGVRAAVRTTMRVAVGGERARRELEAEERAEDTLPDNAFWAGTLARRREREGKGE
jgi:hypothetical protein